MFIFMFDPTRGRFFGPLQITSLLMGMSSRGLLLLHDSSSGTIVSFLTGPLFVSVWVAMGTRQRCQRIKSEFTSQQLATFTYQTLPSSVISTFSSLLFLLGESVSCMAEKMRDNDVNNNDEQGENREKKKQLKKGGLRDETQTICQPVCASLPSLLVAAGGALCENDPTVHFCSIGCDAANNVCQCIDVVNANMTLSYAM